MTNFGLTKAELSLKYRLGLEHALAKADFLNTPDLVLVQAFIHFLFLVRRHDSPRFVWMMTGLAIRMAQSIGLHRDGSHFENLSPFQVEMRRRAWWALCMLDIRASEDQGTEFTIVRADFDTKLPLNIDDVDIDPDTTETPSSRQALTDMSIPLVNCEIGNIIMQMMAPAGKDGGTNIEEQSRMLDNLYEKLDQVYLRYATESGNIIYWVVVTATRLVMSKLTLFIYLPTLFSSPSERFSDQVRKKLLIAAIEVAEWNHALNAEPEGSNWRWIYQTYTHWHAIVYLLIEISRREWLPIIERAWIALHSSWLIPSSPNMETNTRIWVPLRKLMAKARKHRQAEIDRLQGDGQAVELLEKENENMPVPASSGPFANDELFRKHWRDLFTNAADNQRQGSTVTGLDPSERMQTMSEPQNNLVPSSAPAQHHTWTTPNEQIYEYNVPTIDINGPYETPQDCTFAPGQIDNSSNGTPSMVTDWTGGQSIGAGFTPWLWTDAASDVDIPAGIDTTMGLDIDWNALL